ncbi:hypothetical protein GGS20DRAFT_587437 [Poronia punctata]|nr:hypothetical protein GGS20DRAFT_587437 [Poronia punctata]
MDRQIRVELEDWEKKRREEVIAVAVKKSGFPYAAMAGRLLQLYQTTIRTTAVNNMLRHPVGEYPLVSASFQFWIEDRDVWKRFVSKEDKFPYDKPSQYGSPYSLPYLEGFYKLEEEKAAALEREVHSHLKELGIQCPPAPKEELLKRQEHTMRRAAERIVMAGVEKTESREVKMKIVSGVFDNGIGVFFLTPADRMIVVLEPAKAIFVDTIDSIMKDADKDIKTKMEEISSILETEKTTWAKVLPTSTYQGVIKASFEKVFHQLDTEGKELVDSYLPGLMNRKA